MHLWNMVGMIIKYHSYSKKKNYITDISEHSGLLVLIIQDSERVIVSGKTDRKEDNTIFLPQKHG